MKNQEEISKEAEFSSPSQQADSGDSSAAYISLRSRQIFRGAPGVISLGEYLSTFYEKARESAVITEEHCNQLEKEIERAGQLRAEKIQKFKTDTETFIKQLRDYQGFPCRSLELEENIIKEVEIKNNSSDCAISKLETSFLESTVGELSLSDSVYTSPKKTKVEMANYEKITNLISHMVPLFYGERNSNLVSDLHTFIGCCKQVQKCLSEEEKTAFLQILPTRLRGNAYELISTSNFTSLEDIEKTLNNAYLPRETYQEAMSKLITCRQFPLETFSAFIGRVKQCLEHCKEIVEAKYGSTGLDAMKQQLDDFAIAAIKSGATNPHLTMYLLSLSDTKLDDVIKKALDMEKLQQNAPYFQQTIQQNNPFPPAPNLFPFQIQNQQSTSINKMVDYNSLNAIPSFKPNNSFPIVTPNQEYPYLDYSSQTRPISNPQPINTYNQTYKRPVSKVTNSAIMSNITCSYCNIKGHTYDDCLKRKNTPFCIYCKVYGHDVNQCKKRSNHRQISGRDQANSKGEARVYAINKSCMFCGRRGHEVTDCRQKQKWENRDQGNDYQSTENPTVRL